MAPQIIQITLDLKGPAAHYGPLYTYLQQYPWNHYVATLWFIETPKDVYTLARELQPYLLNGDQYFMCPVHAAPYQGLMPPQAWDWLNLRIHGKTFR